MRSYNGLTLTTTADDLIGKSKASSSALVGDKVANVRWPVR